MQTSGRTLRSIAGRLVDVQIEQSGRTSKPGRANRLEVSEDGRRQRRAARTRNQIEPGQIERANGAGLPPGACRRIGGQFDIWLTDPEGTVNVPLVQHPRSDETPSWAPNSRKLVFSSQRRGRADLYVIDVNGENLRRITQAAGENTSPSWGPFKR